MRQRFRSRCVRLADDLAETCDLSRETETPGAKIPDRRRLRLQHHPAASLQFGGQGLGQHLLEAAIGCGGTLFRPACRS